MDTKIILPESQRPKQWYNIISDMPGPLAPVLNPQTLKPASCPTLTKGGYAFDYGDTAKMVPISMMYTLGHDFMPPGIHAGGMRYHGESALVSQLYNAGQIEAVSCRQNACFEAAILFSRSEGIVPAPESSHAVRGAIDEALRAQEEGEEKTILFCLSGHGQLDMGAYDGYLSGSLGITSIRRKTSASH